MSLIYFVRHGQNRANVEHVFSHRVVDYSLTARGLAQARAAAEWFRGRSVASIYSSPLRRAKETAAAISVTTNAPVVEIDELREVNVGELDGRSDQPAWDVYNQTVAEWHQGKRQVRFPGGESLEEASQRIEGFVAEVIGRHRGEDFVVVGHGEIFIAVLPRLLGLDGFLGMETAAITVARCDDALLLTCESWGLTEHLNPGL